MKINQLSCLLVPIIAFSTPVISVPDDDSYGDGNSFLFIRGETTTSPGGFSSVAEPARPSGTKSTAQSPLLKPQARSTSTSLTPTALLQIR